MAIFHLHVKNISRGNGRSVVAAAAYRAGETLPNEAEERDSAFGGRRDVLYAEIRLPAGSPVWMAERALLWNGVEKVEIRKDARLAKEIEVSLPRELPRSEWLGLVRQLANAYVGEGFAVDLAIHDDGSAHNPHAHLLLTTRSITRTGFGPKIRAADGKKFVLDARKLWAKITNTTFGKSGSALTIDHRSHAEVGNTDRPTRHRGPDPAARRARREQMKDTRQDEHRAELLQNDHLDTPAGFTATTVESNNLDAEMGGVWGQSHWHQNDVPVPDPDGNVIPQRELDQAQDAMIAAMEQDSSGSERWFARKSAIVPRAEAPAGDQWYSRRRRSADTAKDPDVDRQQKRDRE